MKLAKPQKTSPYDLRQLPADYKHPSGLHMGSWWGIFEGDRPIIVDKSRAVLEAHMSSLGGTGA